MDGVVVVVELHDSPHEGVVGVTDLLDVALLVVLDRDHHRFLEHVSGLHDAIGEKLSEVLHFLDSNEFLVGFRSRLDVRIAGALGDCVPDLFAAGTTDILARCLLVIVVLIGHILILIILALVLAILAPELVFALPSTAPPHLPTVVTLMHPAAPVEIFFLIVLLAAILARLEATVVFTFALDQFLDPQLRLLLLHRKLLAGLLQIDYFLAIFVVFLSH